MIMKNICPNKKELEFLSLSYPYFFKLHDEIMSKDFFYKEPMYRFSRLKSVFAVYNELLNYPPIVYEVNMMKSNSPKMESEIGSIVTKFIRNIIIHFPFFESWDEVFINKNLVNWNKEGQSIDRFIRKYLGQEQIKYRVWDNRYKEFTYMDINFPNIYEDNNIFLKDLVTEKEGIKLILALMMQILSTQIIKEGENNAKRT